MKRILLLAGSAGSGNYARISVLNKMRSASLDRVWLDKRLYVDFDAGTRLHQNGSVFSFNNYDLIIYWPPSYQYAGVRIGSAYFRKSYDEYLLRCWKVVEDALFLGSEEKMLNSFLGACSAANKINLFVNAPRMGIPMPKTVITNDLKGMQSVEWNVSVLKTITDTIDINEELKIFTTMAPPRISTQQLSPSPIICQEYIEPVCEYRSYFFRGKSLIAQIDRSEDELVDVRLRRGRSLPCRLMENEQIERDMETISRFYNLQMFSTDFIEDAAGGLYLLDVNPHGSWHWMNKKVRDVLDVEFISMIDGFFI